jgi:hypothetical protein
MPSLPRAPVWMLSCSSWSPHICLCVVRSDKADHYRRLVLGVELIRSGEKWRAVSKCLHSTHRISALGGDQGNNDD